jgi:hypothetical protein
MAVDEPLLMRQQTSKNFPGERAHALKRFTNPTRSTRQAANRRGSRRDQLLDVCETGACGARVDVRRCRRGGGTELPEQIDEFGIGRRPVRERAVQNEAP